MFHYALLVRILQDNTEEASTTATTTQLTNDREKTQNKKDTNSGRSRRTQSYRIGIVGTQRSCWNDADENLSGTRIYGASRTGTVKQRWSLVPCDQPLAVAVRCCFAFLVYYTMFNSTVRPCISSGYMVLHLKCGEQSLEDATVPRTSTWYMSTWYSTVRCKVFSPKNRNSSTVRYPTWHNT